MSRPGRTPPDAPMRLAAWVLVATIALGACSGECEGAKCIAPGSRATVELGSAGLTFRVEVAATPAERAKGLMNRTKVPKGTGMLFLFPAPTTGGFWMKDTLVDLDIAFISEGRVMEVRRMTPCRADPCPVTRPAEQYDRALETAAGELASVRPGYPVTVTGILPTPA